MLDILRVVDCGLCKVNHLQHLQVRVQLLGLFLLTHVAIQASGHGVRVVSLVAVLLELAR